MNDVPSRMLDWRGAGPSKLVEARQNLGHVSHSVEWLIKRYPATAVAVSIGLGVLVGWLIKRR
jgi:ElaB/YqjD/DUF883 family membrane-anchored ribosome-binding protein